ncbi:MAG: tyrosine-protein phosphatase [Planctomycetota bacterium]|nr:tyrosine-protein phosphatase [Planctomycetota bacterium]
MLSRVLPLILGLLLWPSVALAQSKDAFHKVAPGEIRIFGTHQLKGQDAQGPYKGDMTVSKDASFKRTKRYNNGQITKEAGRVSVDKKQLKLTFSNQSSRLYRRVLVKQVYSWKSVHKDGWEEMKNGQTEEIGIAVAKRMLKRKRSLHWLLKGNKGTVAKNASFAIYRSKLPTADSIAEWKSKGVTRVLSLNGEQDQKSWYHPKDPKTGRYGKAEEVVLGDFIKDSMGLTHSFVKMSASRAPTDDELVTVFKVLMDEAKGPVLFHCKGGSDRTGVIAALYQIEFLGISKAEAKATMRKHLWAANDGTEIQGLYLDLYRKGHIRALLKKAKVTLPKRFQ